MPNSELEPRNRQIIAAARRNVPRRDIALEHGITEQRVSQIVRASLDPAFPDEDMRAWLLEGYYGDMQRLQEIKDGPGRPVTSGKGDHVIDGNTGQFAYDTSPVADAIRTMAQVRKNIATLLGTEKPPVKPVEEPRDLTEIYRWMREIAKENEELKQTNSALRSRLTALEDGSVSIAEIVDQ